MVRVRLVDSPVSSESEDMVEMIEVPDRMFADGEEPVGIRVLAYHRSSGIQSILRVLSDDEIQFIKDSTFGKFIDLANKPALSGREFAIVTGLPCGKFPKKSRKHKKERMAETQYWPTLFGGTGVVTVSSVIRMLRKKTVVDKEIRIKYALLALVSSVFMPTNLKSKIPKDIKERDEVALCQNTFALKGFVHAMQLAMVEAVPALTEVVQEAGSSSSESESDREDADLHENHNKRLTLSPGHARDVDHKCEGKGKKKETKDGKKAMSPETVSDSKAATQEFASMESRQKLFQMKGDIIQNLNNSDPTSNDTENFQPSENTYVRDEPQHFPEGDIHDSPTRGFSSDKSGLTPSPIVTSLENQMEHSPASKTVKFWAAVNDTTQSVRTGRLEMALRDPFPFIENPSFSLGLSQEEKQDHTDGRSSQEPEAVEEDNQDKLPQRRKSLRLRNSLNTTLPPSTSVDQISEMESFPVIEIPSFSLGLSQDDNNDDLVNGLAAEQVAVEKDNPFDLQECRRGKRQKNSYPWPR
uniref:DUF1985 domain-containing protein n=1 Tax=Brassica oleracea TaxID=3712 RepID=A0A3P6EAS7_BRAOL|nr:unnamed protein product [Brassica oleracea]